MKENQPNYKPWIKAFNKVSNAYFENKIDVEEYITRTSRIMLPREERVYQKKKRR